MNMRDNKRQKGVALILALFTLLFVSLFVVAFIDILNIEQQINTNQMAQLQASFIAEAGLETALYNLRTNSSYSGTGGEVEFPDSSGHYSVTVNTGIKMITSVGTVEGSGSGYSVTIQAYYILRGDSTPYTVLVDSWTWS